LPTTGVSFLCNVPGDDVKHNRCMFLTSGLYTSQPCVL